VLGEKVGALDRSTLRECTIRILQRVTCSILMTRSRSAQRPSQLRDVFNCFPRKSFSVPFEVTKNTYFRQSSIIPFFDPFNTNIPQVNRYLP
jgi:hypothetical protein